MINMSITYLYIIKKFKALLWISPSLVCYLLYLLTFDHLSLFLIVFALLYNRNTTVVNYKKWLLYQWRFLASMDISRIWAWIIGMSNCKLWIKNKLGHCSDFKRYFSFHEALEHREEEIWLTLSLSISVVFSSLLRFKHLLKSFYLTQ